MRSRFSRRATVAGALVVLCSVPVSLAVDASAASGSPTAGGPVPGQDDDAHTGSGGTATSLSRVGTGFSSASAAATPANQRVAGSMVAVGGPEVLSEAAVATMAYVTDRAASRAAGVSRYETAVEVSRAQYPDGASIAFVTTGLDFPDALAASAYAGRLGAPVLLTKPAALPPATLAELVRLAPRRIYVAGGASAVSDAVVSTVRRAVPGALVIRIAGVDRFGTSAELARNFVGTASTAFVATAFNFPDALSASPAASLNGSPLLLSRPGALPPETAYQLSRLKPSTTYVIGGPDVVSDAVVTQIAQRTGGVVVRVSGTDRYQTSAAINDRFFAATTPSLVLSRGTDFADALAGGALAGARRSPLFLNPAGDVPARAELDSARRVSWWVPASGQVLRYALIAHPDDEMSSRAVLSPASKGRYDVFILLTRGEGTGYCNGQPIDNVWASVEFIPQPQPRGLVGSERCKSHRIQSWNNFLDTTSMGTVPSNGVRLTGGPVTFADRTIDPPLTRDEAGNTVPADYVDAYIGPNSARFVFDLGYLTPDRIIWALETVRAHRDLLPTSLEGDVIGAGYHNTSGSGYANTHTDHQAIYDLLSTVDLGLPGSQMSPVGHLQAGRAFGASVADYCPMMCHPELGKPFHSSVVGRFQYAYGWLSDGVWPAAYVDDYAGFSQYQSFGKWF